MDDKDFEIVRKSRKRSREECSIHCSDDDGTLTSPASWESWKSLHNAAIIRNDRSILSLAENLVEGETPLVWYHRKCRQSFTMKSKLDALVIRTNTERSDLNTSSSVVFSSEDPRPNVKTRSSSETEPNKFNQILPTVCLFCNKGHGNRIKDYLIKCVEKRANFMVKKSADRKGDSRILGIISMGDLIAREAHYHIKCYKMYTKICNEEKDSEKAYGKKSEVGEEERDINHNLRTDYEEIELSAFEEVKTFLDKLIEVKETTSLADVTDILKKGFENSGVEMRYHFGLIKNLRRKIESIYQTTIIFSNSRGVRGGTLLYPSTLLMNELVEKHVRLQRDFKKLQSYSSDEKVLFSAAMKIREDIKQIKPNVLWPPLPDKSENIPLPISVKTFYNTLLTGDIYVEETSSSSRVQRLVWSFGQDLINAVTLGKVKTEKHIMIPYAIKSLSGHVYELIKVLNRCGHGLSYSQIEEIDTAIAMQKIVDSGTSETTLPRNITPSCFTHLAWDNIDRNEETLSGGGTSHRVNGIAIQPSPMKLDEHTANRNLPTVAKTKLRTIDQELVTTNLTPYNPGIRIGPMTEIKESDVMNIDAVRLSKTKNLLWVVARTLNPEKQCVASWTGFNIELRANHTTVKSEIGYLPTVDAPASSLTTAFEVLRRSNEIRKKLKLATIVCTFDQALYAKVAEIVWKHPRDYDDIVLSMGGFHIICNYLGILGKRYGDAGLRDLLTEADVIAAGSLGGIINGKHYNRAVRSHKLLYECLMRLAMESYLNTMLVDHDPGEVPSIYEEVITYLNDNELDSDTLNELLTSEKFTDFNTKFTQHLNYLRTQNGSLSTFWVSYLDMVETLLCLIGANRAGNWPLYMSAIRQMIPWCFAYDHLNYAKYLPVFYGDMMRLKEDHPDVHAAFIKGQFSVQMGKHNPFGKIPVDQTIEETINLETQGSSGTVGFSRNIAAVQRHYLTSDVKAAYLHKLKEKTHSGSAASSNHSDLSPARKLRDERDVTALKSLLDNDWINPFSMPMSLVGLSTGIVASPDVEKDLAEASARGEKAFEEFSKSRLSSERTSNVDFYKPVTKMRLKTFSDLKSTKRVATKTKEIVMRAERGLFRRISIIAQSRSLNMKEVLSYPLGPLPWSLATPEGTLRKTVKSKLLEILTKDFPPLDADPSIDAAYIVDGMSLVQKVIDPPKTFGLLAQKLLRTVISASNNSRRLDIVFDVYIKDSIKNLERDLRRQHSSLTPGLRFESITSAHPIKNWRHFLSESTNKTILIKFLAMEWMKTSYRGMLGDKELYITHGQQCTKVTEDDVEDVHELTSNHEEADTRLLLHANHAILNGFKNVVISCDDTDVVVISLHFASCLKESGGNVVLKCGTINRLRYLDITNLSETLGEPITKAIIGLHAITGCDSVSSFAGRGKGRAFSLLKKGNSNTLSSLSDLGEEFDISEDLLSQLEAFVCSLYGSETECNINNLRYQMFCSKDGKVESHSLPPCQDALRKHIITKQQSGSDHCKRRLRYLHQKDMDGKILLQ